MSKLSLTAAVLVALTAALPAQYGCALVADLNSGGSSSPSGLTCCAGRTLYFRADDGTTGVELWKSDASGTARVKDINPGSGGSDPRDFTCCWTGTKQIAVFRADDGTSGVEPWVTDGTPAGTFMLRDVNPGAASGFPNTFTYLAYMNGRVYFPANNGQRHRAVGDRRHDRRDGDGQGRVSRAALEHAGSVRGMQGPAVLRRAEQRPVGQHRP